MDTIDERYPDLVSENAAPEERELVAALDILGATYAPGAEIRTAIVQSLVEQSSAPGRQARPSWPCRVLRSRRALLLVAAIVTTCALVGTVAAAIVTGSRPLEDQALSWNPDYQTGTAQIAAQHLGQSLNSATTTCGFTMTLKRAYADRFSVVLAGTMSGPAGRNFGEPGPGYYAYTSLQDTRGRVFAGGYVGATPPLTNTVGFMGIYDIPTNAAGRSPLQLRLTSSGIIGTEIMPETSISKPACEADGKVYTLPGTNPAALTRAVTVHGPATLAFTVPIDERLRSVSLNDAVTSRRTTLTLRKVQVTPIGVRLLVQGANAEVEGELSLDNPGRRKTTQWSIGFRADKTTMLVDAPLYDYHGSVTLRLTSLRWAANNRQVLPGGPWVFHFTLP